MRGFPRGNNTPHSARNFADWKFVAPCQPPPPSRKPAQGTQLVQTILQLAINKP